MYHAVGDFGNHGIVLVTLSLQQVLSHVLHLSRHVIFAFFWFVFELIKLGLLKEFIVLFLHLFEYFRVDVGEWCLQQVIVLVNITILDVSATRYG